MSISEKQAALEVANAQADPNLQVAPEVDPVDPNSLKALLAAAGPNPAVLKFPTDRWGFTSEIKKSVLKAAATVRGQQDKHDILIGTLAVLIAHIKARLPADRNSAEYFAQIEAAATAERLKRDRIVASPTSMPPVQEGVNPIG